MVFYCRMARLRMPFGRGSSPVIKAFWQKTDEVLFPDPHVHHYNPQLDEEALALMNYWQWIEYPLEDSDI